VAIARKLDAVREPRAKVVNEPHGALAVARTDEIGGNKLRVGIDRNPRQASPAASGAALATATFFCLAK